MKVMATDIDQRRQKNRAVVFSGGFVIRAASVGIVEESFKVYSSELQRVYIAVVTGLQSVVVFCCARDALHREVDARNNPIPDVGCIV